MDRLIQIESIADFSVMGYSMGGRFALTTFSLYPKQINKLYLVASDGLVEGNWYKFATSSLLQRLLFRSVLNSYSTVLALSKNLSKIGVLNKGLLKFAQIHLEQKEDRKRVFRTWTSFRKLTLSAKKMHVISNKHKILVLIVLGNYDRVIPIKRIEPKLIKSQYLTLKKVDITHHKLFYFDFFDSPQNS